MYLHSRFDFPQLNAKKVTVVCSYWTKECWIILEKRWLVVVIECHQKTSSGKNLINSQRQVSVFMNIVLWLKSWYLAEKPVFPPKYFRGGICTSHLKKRKQIWSIFVKSWYWVLILGGHSKDFLPSLMSHLDVNTRTKLSAFSSDKKLVRIDKIPVNTASGILEYRDLIFVCEYWLRRRSVQSSAWFCYTTFIDFIWGRHVAFFSKISLYSVVLCNMYEFGLKLLIFLVLCVEL